ncbi:MAG TPA: glycosyltransferase family 4 protein [Opitutaceae bacterium]|nr:glycosyltransferase family 4 protein [Opitutaceae bacterium]
MKRAPTDFAHRVLMTTDTVGGVWNYALELCRNLSASSVEILLATMGAPPRAEQRDAARGIPGVALRESDFALEWMQDPWTDVARASEWLWELEQEFQPDVVHLNGYVHGTVPWTAPTLMVGHSCVLSWWEGVKGEPAPANWARYREAVSHGLNAAHVVVAPTDWMAGELVRLYQLPRRPRVIHNGRDPSRYDSITAKEDFVLGVGRLWDEAKNLQALAEIAGDLPWRVRLVGDMRSPDGASRAFAGVESLGYARESAVAELMARAALYVMPAKYEPFGLSILEAALSGCALVLGDIPPLREVWGDAAIFVPPGSATALRARCIELIHDDAKRRALGEKARRRALHFTARKMSAAYLSCYRQLTEKSKRASSAR